LKQIGLASLQYATDNKDTFFVSGWQRQCLSSERRPMDRQPAHGRPAEAGWTLTPTGRLAIWTILRRPGSSSTALIASIRMNGTMTAGTTRATFGRTPRTACAASCFFRTVRANRALRNNLLQDSFQDDFLPGRRRAKHGGGRRFDWAVSGFNSHSYPMDRIGGPTILWRLVDPLRSYHFDKEWYRHNNQNQTIWVDGHASRISSPGLTSVLITAITPEKPR
jgi:prepilin-type processing-associated H-X9-DG protein